MTRTIKPSASLLIGLLAIGAASFAWSQSRRSIIHSVDVQVPSAPIPVSIKGKQHLAYELHVTNFKPSEITLTRVEVSDAVRGSRLGDFRDAELDRLLGRLGAPSDTVDKRVIGAGMRAVVYLWLTLDDAVATPARLRHKIELDIIRASRREHVIVDVGESDVRRDRPLVLNPPLRGGPWVALYDPMMTGGHRRTIYAVNGRARIPARFAIDWIRMENDGTCARGDKSQIANWHGYGAEVLAVADGESFTISLDGYGAGPNQSLENPLGVGGESLHEWAFSTLTFQQVHGAEGGTTGVDDDFAARGFRNVGAWILGRNMFGPIRGLWPDDKWRGWWGDNPPYHTPVFVLTHHPREPISMDGGTTFHFGADGINRALERAMDAANGLDVRLGGGVATIRQYLRARLIDEMHIAIAPILLGSGESLFTDIDLPSLGYQCVEHVATQRATHVVIRKTQ